jgi:signal transduction histidine kinase
VTGSCSAAGTRGFDFAPCAFKKDSSDMVVNGIKRFFSAPEYPADTDKTIASSMVLYAIVFGLVAIVLNVPAMLLAGDPPARILATTAALTAALLLNRYLLGRGHIRGAGVLFITLAWIALAAVNYTAGGAKAPGFSTHVVLVICGGFILGRGGAFVLAALSTSLGVCFIYLESRGLLPTPAVHNTSGRYLAMAAANLFIIATILTIMVSRLRSAIAAGKQELLVRQEAERELAQHQSLLEQTVQQRTAQLLEAKRDLESFSYSISHDLRAPLRAISGFASILTDTYGTLLDEEGRRLLSRITAGATRMDSLVQALLTFSQLGREEVHRRRVETAMVVGEIIEKLRQEATGRTVEIVVGDLPACSADPTMLRQVFANLLSNAFKFTRQHAARIEVGSLREHGETAYFVRDNGVGFDSGNADKLFGIFQRLHSAAEFEGTGVGLALVRRIIVKHGGHIRAQAAPGEGATFTFTFQPPDSPSA